MVVFEAAMHLQSVVHLPALTVPDYCRIVPQASRTVIVARVIVVGVPVIACLLPPACSGTIDGSVAAKGAVRAAGIAIGLLQAVRRVTCLARIEDAIST